MAKETVASLTERVEALEALLATSKLEQSGPASVRNTEHARLHADIQQRVANKTED